MKELTGYFYKYFRQEHKIVLILCTLFTTVLITLNYTAGINNAFIRYEFLNRVVAFFFLFSFAFLLPYLVQLIVKKTTVFQPFLFLFLVLGSAFVFAVKISFNGFSFVADKFQYPWSEYLLIICKWPWKLLIVITGILLLTLITTSKLNLPGLSAKSFKWKPYLILLLCTLPLIFLAATQKDFLNTYPKVQTINFIYDHSRSPVFPILFELAYGIDFFTIELFFRGFLILTFVRFVGLDAILPMAVFYCTIHFGKPLAECITSYFGGILLGIITYRTRSIFGGLIVHLGIAWIMELVAAVAKGV